MPVVLLVVVTWGDEDRVALHVDEIVAKLSAVELEQVIKLVGRSPRLYPPGTPPEDLCE